MPRTARRLGQVDDEDADLHGAGPSMHAACRPRRPRAVRHDRLRRRRSTNSVHQDQPGPTAEHKIEISARTELFQILSARPRGLGLLRQTEPFCMPDRRSLPRSRRRCHAGGGQGGVMMATTNRTPPSGAHRNHVQRKDLTMAWTAVASIPAGLHRGLRRGRGPVRAAGLQARGGERAACGSVWSPAYRPSSCSSCPCVAAVWFGNKARVAGQHAALLPMVIGAVLGVWMVIMNCRLLVAG